MKKQNEATLTLTIRRPSGEIESIDKSDLAQKMEKIYFENQIYPKMVSATKAAGKGEIVGFEWTDAKWEMEDADHKVSCARCGKELDSRTAYSQKESARLGSNKVQAITHYCDDCVSTLTSIGQFEKNGLEERI